MKIIDCDDFNTWGFGRIEDVLSGYIDSRQEATSIPYVHVTLGTFAVECMSGRQEDLKAYESFIREDYMSAFKNFKSLDFQNKIGILWNDYRREINNLVKTHMSIDPLKAYTCKFTDSQSMIISEVSIAGMMQSVEEIF